MAAILDFQLANRADLISITWRTSVPNVMLVSSFARFFCYLLHYRSVHRLRDGGGLHLRAQHLVLLLQLLRVQHQHRRHLCAALHQDQPSVPHLRRGRALPDASEAHRHRLADGVRHHSRPTAGESEAARRATSGGSVSPSQWHKQDAGGVHVKCSLSDNHGNRVDYYNKKPCGAKVNHSVSLGPRFLCVLHFGILLMNLQLAFLLTINLHIIIVKICGYLNHIIYYNQKSSSTTLSL